MVHSLFYHSPNSVYRISGKYVSDITQPTMGTSEYLIYMKSSGVSGKIAGGILAIAYNTASGVWTCGVTDGGGTADILENSPYLPSSCNTN